MDPAIAALTVAPGSDVTADLQRALDAATRDGNAVALEAGRYDITGLRLPSGARLIGIPGETRLVAHGGEPVVSADGASRVALSGLTFEGHGSMRGEGGLIEFRDVGTLEIDDCEIDGSTASGIHLERCGGRIGRSRVAFVRDAAIFSLDGRELNIDSNRISDCGDNGILVWQSAKREDGSRITGNRIERIRANSGGNGPYGNGINVFRGGSVMVVNNVIDDCAFSAVRNNGGDNIIVSGNMCRRLGEVALYVEFGFEGAVVSSNVIDGAVHGISVTNFNDGGRLAVISGNLVRNIFVDGRDGSGGTGISAEANSAVSGNVVETAEHAGITLGWGPYLRDVTATGNVVRSSPIGIGVSVADGAGGAVISGNAIAGASRGAIVGMAWNEVVTGDLARAGADDHPRIAIERNQVS